MKTESANKISIKPLQLDKITEATKLLSIAFIQTEFSSKNIGGKEEKHRRFLEKGFKIMLEKKPGETVVAVDNGEIVGVMRMIEWPDCQNSTPRGLEKLPALILGRGAALRLFKFRSIWGRHNPKKSHWYIDPLGVLPERQGQGIGSKLLTYFCNRVDINKAEAYLETDQDRNVRLYNRFGFKEIEKEPIFDVTNWFLLRPSQNN